MMQQKSESRAMVRVILTLAWPTMLEQMSQSAVQYIDTAMVGALGTQATAAVGATSTVGWLVNSSITAFGQTGSIYRPAAGMPASPPFLPS